ncbi:MAG: LPS export ABC transporter periplasmic protein LptC [Chitinophagaceae bacterium]
MNAVFSKYSFRTAALLLGCCLLIQSCENDPQVVDNLFRKQVAVEEAFKVESYMSQDGKVKAKLTAPYMLRSQSDSAYLEFPRTVHVDFYKDSVTIESVLDARYAKYLEFMSKVLLRDSVVVINRITGDTLRTEELWWDQNKQEFYTDKPARINQRMGTSFAKTGLRAAQNLNWYEFYTNTGTRKVKENEMMP